MIGWKIYQGLVVNNQLICVCQTFPDPLSRSADVFSIIILLQDIFMSPHAIEVINPRRACAALARVTVFDCPVSVCLSGHISPLERLFVLKTQSRTQRATKVKLCLGVSLKALCCRDPAPHFTASVQCEGTHSLGICSLKRLTIGQRLPGTLVNVRQRRTFLFQWL